MASSLDAQGMADAESEQFTITLLGDIMLGRLIDQLLPTHVDEPEEAQIVSSFRQRSSHLQSYTHASPWGNALSLFKKSDLILGNLETSATVHEVKWPDKVFNYRMHPDNVKCLLEAGIDYVSLANNHTLDFSKEGLLETIKTLRNAGIAFAGAGESVTEAEKPAELKLRRRHRQGGESNLPNVHIYSFSDHPRDWSIPEFSLLQYTSSYKHKLKALLTSDPRPALKIVSIHWGPNYRWQPDQQIRDMAHYLLDSCEVDIIWGHSSHHIQGVEVHNGKLIIYGCGDFVDDYAVNHEYRNDLSAAWNLKVDLDDAGNVKVQKLEVWPNQIKQFQAGLLQVEDSDHELVVRRFMDLSKELGTTVEEELGDDGQIVVDLGQQ